MPVKLTAGDRLKRVLAIVPWIVANPGVELSVVADRFGLSEDELVEDLNVVWMVGVPPYTPDALVEVRMDEGRVWIDYADFFARPLRLTPAQGLAMLASTDGLLSVPGTDAGGPLARALQKLSGSLGLEADEAVDVDLGDVAPDILEQLRIAAAQQTEVDIAYYSYGRDELTERRIAPWRVTSGGGAWYVEAWCHRAEGDRVFRIDRITSLEPTQVVTDHPAPVDEADGPAVNLGGSLGGSDSVAQVVLDVSPRAAWVIDTYPSEELDNTGSADGWRRVALPVTALPWLERLLLRLGPDAEPVSERGLGDVRAIGDAAARRVLARYNH